MRPLLQLDRSPRPREDGTLQTGRPRGVSVVANVNVQTPSAAATDNDDNSHQQYFKDTAASSRKPNTYEYGGIVTCCSGPTLTSRNQYCDAASRPDYCGSTRPSQMVPS